MDHLLASSWYTPRLGYKNLSPEELVKGPQKIGPPQKPVTVIKAKTGGNNPGFIVEDSRGYRYLVKFDPPEYPRVETTTALIVNRLFWGFGYNVPEDYLFLFRQNDLMIDSAGELSKSDVEEVLGKTAAPVEGMYTSTASLFIEGKILGSTHDHGVNKSDLNDWIPHENRRILRAMRVFGAFTNHVGMRPDNSLDVYVGEPGNGYVKHYLLDFGEALGGHGAGRQVLWNGFEHFFSFEEMAANFITLGFRVKPWENTNFTPWKSVGPLEAVAFNPKTWKEITQYQPIQVSLPEDDYWAAKVVGSLNRDHIRALVTEANYPKKVAADYVVDILMKRRQKIIDYSFYKVTPVESNGLKDNILDLHDMGRVLKTTGCDNYKFSINFFNTDKKEIMPPVNAKIEDASFPIEINEKHLKKSSGYLIVAVEIANLNNKQPRAAEFHIRFNKNGEPILVGVVH
jgi:hypothetical protein